jgi:hypothetical protein
MEIVKAYEKINSISIISYNIHIALYTLILLYKN